MTTLDPGHPGRRWTGAARAGMARAALLALALWAGTGAAQAEDSAALKTESPYFALDGGDPALDRLPLKGTQVKVNILGPIAEVTVTQQYRNEGQRPIEARYVFPGSTQAAVHAMNVRLGDRLLTAHIREKQAARAAYEQAKTAGRTAALLEQHRPNVFQMNVANILPGDDVKVELRYTELLPPRDGRYEFVFPTVVGPRYNSPDGSAARERWLAMPFKRAGQPPTAAFDLQVTLDTPVPATDIDSPSHRLRTEGASGDKVHVTLGADDRPPHNRDFVLRYGLGGAGLQSGLTLWRGASENFFLAMVQPPKTVAPAAIVPRDYVFVVDISGSMHGFPLDTAKVVMAQLLRGLKSSDTFNVMLFSGSTRTLAPQPVPATQANVDAALALLRETRGGGSTELVPALRQIAAYPKHADVSRSVVVVTDGYVAVERDVFQLIRSQLNTSNVFAFGIGSAVNRHLIEGIARAGQGEAFVITRPDEAAPQAERFRRMIEAPVLTQVKAHFEGLQVDEVEPALLPDVLGARPVLLFGKWKGEPRGRLVVEGRNAAGPQRIVVDVAGTLSPDAAALQHLWARERIAALADEEALLGGRPHRPAITELGLRYSLLTAYTSFLAVDERVRTDAAATAVDQPSPLPEGVSNHAVGAAVPAAVTAATPAPGTPGPGTAEVSTSEPGTPVPSTPEPATWAALAVMLAVLGMAGRRGRRGA